jgi:hypothetical protein
MLGFDMGIWAWINMPARRSWVLDTGKRMNMASRGYRQQAGNASPHGMEIEMHKTVIILQNRELQFQLSLCDTWLSSLLTISENMIRTKLTR